MITSLLFYGLLLVFTFFAVAAFNWLVFPVLCAVLLWGLIVTAFKPAE